MCGGGSIFQDILFIVQLLSPNQILLLESKLRSLQVASARKNFFKCKLSHEGTTLAQVGFSKKCRALHAIFKTVCKFSVAFTSPGISGSKVGSRFSVFCWGGVQI